MYCSNDNGDDCTHLETLVRVGLPFTHFFGLEDLFYKYGVDIEIWAHEHDYERLWPIYNYKVYNGSYEAPYTNPKAPVHIVTGSAGCKEGREPFLKELPEWSAFHSRVSIKEKFKCSFPFSSNSIHFFASRIMATHAWRCITNRICTLNKYRLTRMATLSTDFMWLKINTDHMNIPMNYKSIMHTNTYQREQIVKKKLFKRFLGKF